MNVIDDGDFIPINNINSYENSDNNDYSESDEEYCIRKQRYFSDFV